MRDFAGPGGVSLGLAQGVLDALQETGCLERVKKGPVSYAALSDAALLLSEWTKAYKFSRNTVHTYYTPQEGFLRKLQKAVPAEKYALTLHSGANLLTGYASSAETHVYLLLDDWEAELPALREALDLRKLAQGGNVHLVRPYYRTAAFTGRREIKGLSVVSPLQLYLDLYNYRPRGREHAEYLKETIERQGGLLA